MYSSEYEEEQVNNSSNGSFYQNNKKLVWIFIAIVLFVIVVVILKNKTGSSFSDNNSVNDISIAIYPESDVSVAPGNTYKLVAIVNNNHNATINWSSSDENVLKVDGGTVTAIDYGKATVIASYIHSDNNKYEALKEITVANGKAGVQVTEVSIKDGDLVMPVDGKYTIGLDVVPTNAYITSKVFKSSNESVVIVDNKGMVEAKGEGEATITINVNNGAFNKELKVFVSNNYTESEIVTSPTKISLNKESNKIKVGGTVKLSYTVIPSEARNSYLIWTSSDESVLTVDNTGIITAIKEGKTTIKLSTLNGISDTLDIEVIPNAVLVTDISLSISDIYLETGQSQIITPVIIPETATDKTLSYISSDESIMKVEPTNEGTACSITGVRAGTATLTMKANSGDVSREFTVTVGSSNTYINPGSGGSSGGGSSCRKTCPDGQYVSNCKCVGCPAGSYCTGGKKNSCPAGKGSSANASSCSACTGNTYSKGGVCTTCPNNQKANAYHTACYTPSCSSGEYLNGSTCTKCPAGYKCNGSSKTACDGNTYSTGGTSTCYNCGSGKQANATHTNCYTSSNPSSTCTEAGKYWNGSACVTCPANSYCVGGRKYSCPSGTHTTMQGAGSISACVKY